MADTPTHAQINTLLDRMDALVQQLQREPWAEYDRNLQKALLALMRTGFQSFQRVAKAISRVTPEETRAPEDASQDPWREHWNNILDQMQ